ncbi:MAG: hypothetical protein WAT43_10530 [Chitinophagales bacterium]
MNVKKIWTNFLVILFQVIIIQKPLTGQNNGETINKAEIYEYAVGRTIEIIREKDTTLLVDDTLLLSLARNVEYFECKNKTVKFFDPKYVNFSDGSFPILTIMPMEIRDNTIEITFDISYLIVKNGARNWIKNDGSYIGFKFEFNEESNFFSEISHYFSNDKP